METSPSAFAADRGQRQRDEGNAMEHIGIQKLIEEHNNNQCPAPTGDPAVPVIRGVEAPKTPTVAARSVHEPHSAVRSSSKFLHQSKRDTSTGPLLRSLELRFQLENELIHVVDKFRNMHSRHVAEDFSKKIHELETYKLTVDALKEKLSTSEARKAQALRKVADLERDKAAQLVEIMTLREKTVIQSSNDNEARVALLKEKDEEIQALNEHLGSIERQLAAAKTNAREYRERCEKAEVQMMNAVESLKALEASATGQQETHQRNVAELEGRVQDGEAYRNSVNDRLSQMEDEVSSLNSTILKLKGELGRANQSLEQQAKVAEERKVKLGEAEATLDAFYSSSREEHKSGLKTKEAMDDMKREILKLKNRDKARYNEGALEVAKLDNDRLRASLAEGQKQIDELEKQNIMLMRKLADSTAAVEKAKAEAVTVQQDAEVRVQRLENNIRVLCQNIESSNSILSMRSRKPEEAKRPPESKADMVRREMEEWQSDAVKREEHDATMKEIEALDATTVSPGQGAGQRRGSPKEADRKAPGGKVPTRIPGSPYMNAGGAEKAGKKKKGNHPATENGRRTIYDELSAASSTKQAKRKKKKKA